MASQADVFGGLYAAFRFVTFDRSAERLLGKSRVAFWWSFLGPLLALPGFLLFNALFVGTLGEEVPGALALLSGAIGYGLGVLAVPLVLAFLSDAFERPDNWIPAVIALNWAGFIETAIVLFFVALYATGMFPAALGGFLLLAAMIFCLVYEWFVARTALGISGLAAAGTIILLAIVAFLMGQVADILLLA